MKTLLLKLNRALLFICLSMYLGTGWSMVLFSFPIAPKLTPATYYNQFVPQIAAATEFFTWMTMVMMACCLVFILETYKNSLKWYPVLILFLTVMTTLITVYHIFPYNHRMAEGIHDPAELQAVLSAWIRLNVIRVLIWTAMWVVLMVYYTKLDVPSIHSIPRK